MDSRTVSYRHAVSRRYAVSGTGLALRGIDGSSFPRDAFLVAQVCNLRPMAGNYEDTEKMDSRFRGNDGFDPSLLRGSSPCVTCSGGLDRLGIDSVCERLPVVATVVPLVAQVCNLRPTDGVRRIRRSVVEARHVVPLPSLERDLLPHGAFFEHAGLLLGAVHRDVRAVYPTPRG